MQSAPAAPTQNAGRAAVPATSAERPPTTPSLTNTCTAAGVLALLQYLRLPAGTSAAAVAADKRLVPAMAEEGVGSGTPASDAHQHTAVNDHHDDWCYTTTAPAKCTTRTSSSADLQGGLNLLFVLCFYASLQGSYLQQEPRSRCARSFTTIPTAGRRTLTREQGSCAAVHQIATASATCAHAALRCDSPNR